MKLVDRADLPPSGRTQACATAPRPRTRGVFAALGGLLSVALAGGAAVAVAADSGLDETSWANLGPNVAAVSTDFDPSASAATRAKMRSPLLADGCVPIDTAADGARPVVQLVRVYMPLLEGTAARSSAYGYRIHPVTGEYSMHEGEDFQAPSGTPIYSIMDGVVVDVGWGGALGFRTVIRHIDTDGTEVESWYGHQIPSDTVAPGDVVEAGQQIGVVGSTGRSTGPHLHLEIHPAGGVVAPLPWLESHEAVFLGSECQ